MRVILRLRCDHFASVKIQLSKNKISSKNKVIDGNAMHLAPKRICSNVDESAVALSVGTCIVGAAVDICIVGAAVGTCIAVFVAGARKGNCTVRTEEATVIMMKSTIPHLTFEVPADSKYKTIFKEYKTKLRKNRVSFEELKMGKSSVQIEGSDLEILPSDLIDFFLCLIAMSDIFYSDSVSVRHFFEKCDNWGKIAAYQEMYHEFSSLLSGIQTKVCVLYWKSSYAKPKEILARILVKDMRVFSAILVSRSSAIGLSHNLSSAAASAYTQYQGPNKNVKRGCLKEEPGYIVLQNPELRIRESPDITVFYYGAGAFDGQPKLDPRDSDSFESKVGKFADVLHVLPEVEEDGSQHQHPFLDFATEKYQALDIMPVINSAPASSLLVDLNEEMFLFKEINAHLNFCIQSFSVFSEVGISLSSKSRLKRFLPYTDVHLSPKSQLKEWICPTWDYLLKLVTLKHLKRSCDETIAVLSNLKRKEIPEDHNLDGSVKRKRNVGVATKPTEEFHYNEEMDAFSLHKKKPVSETAVNFLTDLKAWNRKRRLQVIQESFKEEVVESIEITEKDLEVLKFDITNPVHRCQSFCLVGLVMETPRLAVSDTLTFGKSLPLISPEDTKAVIITRPEPTSSKVVIFTDQTVEADLTDVEEEVGNEITGVETYPRKKLEIRIQDYQSEFKKQSDVTYVSKYNLLKALISVRSDTFVNLENKNIQGSSCKQDKVNVKGNKPKLNEETPSENVALLRELTCIKNVELPDPQIDFDCLLRAVQVFHIHEFEPVMAIIDQIANGTPPTPHVSMRYELLRFCTLRSYPKENKPHLIRLAMAGFYYASDGDGVVCYCCGTRRYNWVAKDDPMKVHQRINPNCKFLKKNEEVNVPVTYYGPYSEKLTYIMNIPEPVERPQVSEDVNNDWAPERIRSPAPAQQNSQNESGASSLGINTAIPKHAMYAPKTTREASYNGWPDSSSHTPQELSDAGFFYAGFGDCVRCFYCGIGLRHWARDDNPWIEHARWSRNCVYLRQKKGEEFVNLVQFALQYSQKEADAEQSSASGNQVPVLDVEKILLSDAAQSVLEMGYPPIKIKRAIEEILRRDGNVKITASVLMQKVLDMEEVEKQTQSASVPAPTPAATAKPQTVETSAKSGKPASKEIKSNTAKGKTEGSAVSNTNTIEKENSKNPVNSNEEAKSVDPKAIKAENELLKEQTLCKVCLDNTVCIVFLPCGHLVTCADCAPAMRKCPICRALVKGTVRTYMP